MDQKMVTKKVKKLQKQILNKVNKSPIFKEVQSFAKAKSKVLKKRAKTNADLQRLLAFVDARSKEIDQIAKTLPKELKALEKYAKAQRSELEKIGDSIMNRIVANTKKKKGTKKKTTKKAAAKRTGKKATKKAGAKKTGKKAAGRKKTTGRKKAATRKAAMTRRTTARRKA